MEINALNEQAEELTEHDTPPIDQHLLQLNQRWVGIRSRVENFKPNGIAEHDQTNGTISTVELSPPTVLKYKNTEYAVINKNRKNASIPPTSEITFEGSPTSTKHAMTLDLASPNTPTNTTALFVASPAIDLPSSISRCSSTPGSGIDVDDESISLDELTTSTSSKRSIAMTDLDEAAKTVSTGSLRPDAAVSSTSYTDEQLDDFRRLMSRVGILQHQLNQSGIEVDQYTHENFTTSPDLLLVSKEME